MPTDEAGAHEAMGDQVGAEGPTGRARRWILGNARGVRREHPRVHAAGLGIRISREDEDAEVGPFAHRLHDAGHVERGAVHRGLVPERDEQEGAARRAGADGRARPQVRLRQAEGRGERGPIGELGPERGLAVAHPEKARARRVALELDLDGPDLLFEEEARGPARQEPFRREHPARADGRVAGERHLARGGEDAHARRALRPRGRQEEGRLREVHLPRDRLHLGVAEIIRVEDDGQRIAAEDTVREDVDLGEAALARHPDALAAERGQRPPARSISKIRRPVSGTVFTSTP